MNITDFVAENNDEIDIDKIKKTDEFKTIEESDLIEKFLTNYGNLSEEELLKKMLSIVAEKKKDGSFDAEKIKSLVNKIEPLLNDEQKAKMKNLLNFVV